MGHSTFDELKCCTLDHNPGLVSQVMTLSHTEPSSSGVDGAPETLELKDIGCNVYNAVTDEHVLPSEVRDSNIDEGENGAKVSNRVEAARDTRRLLPVGVDESSSQVGEGACHDINELVQSLQGEESCLSIISQISLPFLVAGYGTVAAGLVLDEVQHWAVFVAVREIFILVPALLGLKGNLEMTLASRLSTQAHLGNMDTKKEVIKMICGNVSLVQAQAIVVGFLSSVTAITLGWISKGEFHFNHGLLLCAASLFTASTASFILGTIMVIVVLLSRLFKINPDNVATPIAASLGDLVTLSILAWTINHLYEVTGKYDWLAPVMISVFLLLLPLWVTISIKNKYTNDVIFSGWTPVLSAMLISSMGGMILHYTVSTYKGIAVFQPIINGVGGNLVAIHASRLSTSLHLKGRQPGESLKGCLNIFKVYFGPGIHARASRVLILLTLPGHLLFSYTVIYMDAGHTSNSIVFQCFYLTAALVQVTLLIYISTWFVPLIWIRGSDPDNVAIPYLTAIGDLLGIGFLAAAFHFLYLVGERGVNIGD